MADLSLIRLESERTKDVLALHVARAAAFIIYDEDSYKLAESYIKEVKTVAQTLEAKRDEYVEPLKKAIDVARKDVKPRLDAADQIESILKGKCLEFRANIMRLKADAERKAQELLKQIDAPVQEKRAALVAVATTVVPITSGVSYRKTRRGTVVDISKVPEKYFVRQLSQTAIDLDVANGIAEIPGVKIEEIETMAVSTVKK